LPRRVWTKMWYRPPTRLAFPVHDASKNSYIWPCGSDTNLDDSYKFKKLTLL
jgi:hypothetical protein